MDRGGPQGAMKAVVKDCHIKKKYPSTAYAIVEQSRKAAETTRS
jgi:hypothetical protein